MEKRMDDMDMGRRALPWLDTPIMLHSSRADTCKLTPAQCAYRNGHWRYWYQSDHVYGHATIYFMCAVIGVFTIANVVSKLSSSKRKPSNGLLQRGLAGSRFLAYKTFHLRSLNWFSPSIGVMALGVCGFVYFLALTMGPQPYYWPNTKTLSYGGSPPIATRSGWMALGLLPFVMLLSSKSNYITLLTGISHEKLQVFHRWTSWAMFALALVHTFPFIVYHLWKGDMMMMWATEVTYWTGVAALIPQAYLNIMSIGPIRNRYYEYFKSTHYLAIGFFIFFFFIHCDFRLTSWDYFIAALSLYATTLVFSFLRTSINSLDANAAFEKLADGTLKITIPTSISWKPGQHVFLRFWTQGFHAMSMHPFTICSLPSPTDKFEKDSLGPRNKMVFYVKSAGGFTSRLKSLIEKTGGRGYMPMSIDGPYGDNNTAASLASYSRCLLVSGGSGAGYLLGLLEALMQEGSHAGQVKVIIAVRHSDSAIWLLQALETLLAAYPRRSRSVKVELHTTDSLPSSPKLMPNANTDDVSSAASSSSLDVEKSGVRRANRPVLSKHSSILIIQGQGRPHLARIVARECSEGLGVAACGPAEMMLDIRNSCAHANWQALRQSKPSVWLHTESFAW